VVVHADPEDEAARTTASSLVSPELASAATLLYREHFTFVWRNARHLGCSDDWIDDAVHETFLVASRRLGEFEGRSSERTWLFGITFRVVQRMQRDRARRQQRVTQYARQQPPPVGNAARESEDAQYLGYLLGLLPEAQRLVLILAEIEGFTTPEIAATLGIPAGTVHSRLRAAKRHLAQVIERESAHDERPTP
jgi:RNA polymerase sigma-70 factor, ECF subfamily